MPRAECPTTTPSFESKRSHEDRSHQCCALVCRSGFRGLDELAAEEPLEICVGDSVIGVTMRTPGSDIELAAGFLLTEGILQPGVIPAIRQEHPNRVRAAVQGSVDRAQRSMTISASCGICGKY
jgi:formate dehydrogenase assembly factor FdhD